MIVRAKRYLILQRDKSEMIIYVKEFTNVLIIKNISHWIKKNIELRKFISIDDVQLEDIIIISELDSFSKSVCKQNIIIYEEIFEIISHNIMKEYHYNNDFYF